MRVFPADEAVRIRLDLEQDHRVIQALGDREIVQIMLQNLVKNALRYSSSDTRVDIRVTAQNGTATVEVQDRREGIPQEHLDRVFSRFYRVDKSRSRETGGSGLGLGIVDEIATAHGIEVSLQNRPDGGVLASFSLPIAPPVISY